MITSRDFSTLQRLLKSSGVSERSAIAVGGLHNGGLSFAKFAFRAGFRVMAVADDFAGIIDIGGNGGLKVPELINYRKNGNDFSQVFWENIRKTKPGFLMRMEVDILVPEVKTGILNEENAFDVRAKVVIQTGRGLVTYNAAQILERKMIPLITLYT